MTTDAIIRAAAVAAAVALVVAPKWGVVLSAAVRLCEAARDAAKAHGKTAGRVAAAGLIVAAAWGKVPLPTFSVPTAVPAVKVETPSDAMQKLVADVGKQMANASDVDRALWADTWNKAAVVVAGDGVSPEVAFTDTKSLRAFTSLALDIAWRRIGEHAPGSQEDLRVAVEAAYAKALGVAEVSVTKDISSQYAEFARAMAWAGYNRG